MAHSYGLDIPDDRYERIVASMETRQPMNSWFYDAADMKLEIEEAVESSAMDGELDEDWWRDWLYNAAREELDKREQQMLADERAGRDESEA